MYAFFFPIFVFILGVVPFQCVLLYVRIMNKWVKRTRTSLIEQLKNDYNQKLKAAVMIMRYYCYYVLWALLASTLPKWHHHPYVVLALSRFEIVQCNIKWKNYIVLVYVVDCSRFQGAIGSGINDYNRRDTHLFNTIKWILSVHPIWNCCTAHTSLREIFQLWTCIFVAVHRHNSYYFLNFEFYSIQVKASRNHYS